MMTGMWHTAFRAPARMKMSMPGLSVLLRMSTSSVVMREAQPESLRMFTAPGAWPPFMSAICSSRAVSMLFNASFIALSLFEE